MYNILLNGLIWNNLSQSKLVLKNTTVFELWAGTWKGKTYAHTHTYCIARATVRHRQTWLNPEDLIYQMSHQTSKWYHQKITKVTFSFPALLSPSLHSFGFIISFRWCYDDLSNSFDRPCAFVYHFSTNTAPQFFLPFFFFKLNPTFVSTESSLYSCGMFGYVQTTPTSKCCHTKRPELVLHAQAA